jgi:hypothetical protein
MWVEYVWPGCEELGERPLPAPVDVFWVECRPDESLDILALNRRDTGKPLYPPAASCHRESLGGVWQYFLVTRDCKYVESTPRLYPFSNGAQGRFNRLQRPQQIGSLSELSEIELP